MLQWLTDGEPTVAVLEFVTVGTDHTAFLSGSVKGGGRLEGTFGKPTTHYKLRITKGIIDKLLVHSIRRNNVITIVMLLILHNLFVDSSLAAFS